MGVFRHVIRVIGIAAALLAVSPRATLSAEPPVTVFAAASLTSAMDAVAEAAESAGLPACRCVYAASSNLARQVAAGGPAEIFVSANRRWMDYAAHEGAIDKASQRVLVTNRLVLVAPAKATFTLAHWKPAAVGAAIGDGWLAMGDPDHVPAGIYGRAALRSLGLWESVSGRIARAGNVRAALAFVARGEAAAGIVYESDLKVTPKVTLVRRFPAHSHPPIDYAAATVAGPLRPVAQRYFDFLFSDKAQALFMKYGFSPPRGS